MTELGVGYVSLVPSASGFGTELRRLIGQETQPLGDESPSSPFGRLGSGAARAFAAAFAVGTAALVAGAARGLGDALNREDIFADLAQTLGVQGEEAERFGGIAGNLYGRAFGDSLEGVADAVAATQQNLGDFVPVDELEAAAEAGINLGRILEEDVGGVARTAGQLLRTGLADSAEEAFDLITFGAQNGLNRSEDLLDTLNEYAPAFARLGIDGSQALGLIEAGLDAGAFNSDKIGDAFNEFGIRVIDGSVASSEALQTLGLDAERVAATIAAGGPAAASATDDIIQRLRGIDDQVAQDAAGVALFGSIWEDLGADIITALEPGEVALDGIGGAAEALSDGFVTPRRRLESLKRRGFQALANVATRFLLPALEGALDLFDDFGGTVDRASRFLRPYAPIIAGVAAAIGVGLVAAFIAWASAAAAAAAATLVALAPIIAIGVAIGVLVAAIVYAYQNFETFRNIVDAVGRFFRDDFVPILQSIGAFGAEAFDRIVSAVTTAHDFIAGVIEDVWPTIEQIITGVMGTIQGVIDVVLGALSGDWSRVWTGIQSVFEGVWEAISAVPGRVLGAILSTARGIFDDLLDAITSPFSTGLDIITDALDSAVDFISDSIDTIVGFFVALPGQIGSATVGAFDGLADAFRSAVNVIIRGWNSLDFTLPGVSTPFGDIGGFTIGTPDIPLLASGGRLTQGGLTIVGEEGAELLNLPAGAEVIPLSPRSAALPDRLADPADAPGTGTDQSTNVEQNFYGMQTPAAVAAATLFAVRTSGR